MSFDFSISTPQHSRIIRNRLNKRWYKIKISSRIERDEVS